MNNKEENLLTKENVEETKERRNFPDLNEQQLKAVISNESKICVIAGPGCGKTKTLISRTVYLLKQKTNKKILILTFGKKAIREIKERINNELKNADKSLASKVQIYNIHSFCYKFLRENYHFLDFLKPDFIVCDLQEQKNVLKQVFFELKINFDEKFLNEMNKEINAYKLELNIESFTKSITNFKIYTTYQKLLKEVNKIYFSDLLVYTLEILERNESVRYLIEKIYGSILVDEFQDINQMQWKIIKFLNSSSSNLFLVGDPNQCIYGFQGAIPELIKNLEQDKNWRIFYLNINYRSNTNILNVSNIFLREDHNLIKNFLTTNKKERESVKIKKNFSTYKITEIIYYLLRLKKVPIGEIAVIYRSNYLSSFLEKELVKKKIPYQILGDYKFINRQEIRDVLSYLRAIVFQENSDLIRIISILKGIGENTVKKIESNSRKEGKKIFHYLLALNNKEQLDISEEKMIILRNFIDLLEIFRTWSSLEQEISVYTEKVVEQFDYLNLIKEEKERIKNVERLINIVRAWEKESEEKCIREQIIQFLNYLAISFEEKKENGNFLILSSVHQVKGLEFSVVIFAYLDKEVIPSSISEDQREESRIFYVGITRAKKFLYLLSSRTTSPFLDIVEKNASKEIDVQETKNVGFWKLRNLV